MILFADKNKWGFETILFDEIRFDLIEVIDKADLYKEMNILEIGCGLEATLIKIKKDYPNIRLYGVEPYENIAKHIAKVTIKKIGDFPLEFPEEHFDYILIGNYLKKGGYIIGAAQNIMYYSVLRNLLNGNWIYSNNDNLNTTLQVIKL
ncbi:hypothetical protein [Cellulosilyticum sp. I15G10I2]|uniref:hypothetical protein n=1 Tax=Cellulosilyticum sp. I15G10I2 TaxID=1892843 RepID=UPI00085BDE38|nr:hypothetical protein [Cellulosilyticum sp. I15G10I2]